MNGLRHTLRCTHSWLIAHGLEFEFGECAFSHTNYTFTVVINHRYYGMDFGLTLVPFKGVYDDELNTPHAVIAAGRGQWHQAQPAAVATASLSPEAQEFAELLVALPEAKRQAVSLVVHRAYTTPNVKLSEHCRELLKLSHEDDVRAALEDMRQDFERQESEQKPD